jgi:hypothetical protein
MIILDAKRNTDFKTARHAAGKYDHLPVHERLYIQHKEVD